MSSSALHVALDVTAILTHMVDVGKRRLIYLVDVRNYIALNPLIVHGEFRLKPNFWQLVS